MEKVIIATSFPSLEISPLSYGDGAGSGMPG